MLTIIDFHLIYFQSLYSIYHLIIIINYLILFFTISLYFYMKLFNLFIMIIIQNFLTVFYFIKFLILIIAKFIYFIL